MPQEKDRGNKLKAGALGVGGTGLGASIIKKTYDRGNLTGRETLFHGTSAERAKQGKGCCRVLGHLLAQPHHETR